MMVALMAAVACALGVAACGGGGDGSPTRTDVAVTLLEWEIGVEPATARAGEVTFELNNSGEVPHNFVIAKSDLPPGELPVSDGAVDTSRVNLEGSTGPIAPGPPPEDDEGYTASLTPGKYVLFCDVVVREGGEVDSHYRNGMHTSFLVEP